MLLIMIGIGFFIAGKSWFSTRGTDVFSAFLIRVGLPCYMFDNMVGKIGTRQELLRLLALVPVPALSICAAMALAALAARLLRVKPGRRGVFINVAALSNTVIIGFPVITSLLGEGASAIGMAYYIANTLCFWFLGVLFLRADSIGGEAFDLLRCLRGVISPPVAGLAIGMLVVLLGVPVPAFLVNTSGTIGAAVTPLAMVFIGSIIRHSRLRGTRLGRDTWAPVLFRFLLTPAITLLVLTLAVPDPAIRVVFFVLSTMPAMTQLGVMSKECACDSGYASVLITITTAISMGAIPLYALFIEYSPFFV